MPDATANSATLLREEGGELRDESQSAVLALDSPLSALKCSYHMSWLNFHKYFWPQAQEQICRKLGIETRGITT